MKKEEISPETSDLVFIGTKGKISFFKIYPSNIC